MNKYPIVPLGEVCDFVYGNGLKETDRKGGNVPVYGSNGIVGWHDEAITKGETLIIGRKGSIGEVHFSIIPCWAIDTTYYVDKTKVPCDFTWLYYTLKALDLTRLNKSAAVPGLNREDAYEQKIPLPPLTEQKRIASLLARADRLRHLRRTAHDLSDSVLQSVFLEMFGDINQYEKVLFGELATKAKNSFTNGPFGSNLLTTELVSKGVPVVYIRDIRTGYYQRVSESFVTPQKAKELDVCRVDGGDVIIAKVGDPPGTAAVYPISEPAGVVSQDVIRIKPNRKMIHPEFLVKLLNSEVGYRILQPILVEGTRERFGLTPMKQLEVPVPPLSLQEEFAGVVARVESLRGRMSEGERQVEGLFESLLAESFGEGIEIL